MPNKPRSITIKINPYGATLKLFTSLPSYRKAVEKAGETTQADDNCCGETTAIGNQTIIVGIFDNSFNTLVHELTHVCTIVLMDTDSLIHNNTFNDEPLAYLLGWLTEEVMKKLHKVKAVNLIDTQGE